MIDPKAHKQPKLEIVVSPKRFPGKVVMTPDAVASQSHN
jgi:hypothetical protein